ncbi:MAG: GNAT family N-acetyltransferase [Patescibacteria group bacterium]
MTNMNNPNQPTTNEVKHEKKEVLIGGLVDLDMAYFRQLEGKDGWIAIGQGNCRNQNYFTVLSDAGEKLGIVGVYDTDDEENISHTVVDPKYRGRGLAMKFKERLMDELGLPFLTLTIDLDNTASIKAAEKIPGIKKVSDKAYEQEFHKAKYIQESPKEKK